MNTGGDPLPVDALGAILALGYAADETTARYWLAQCARRGVEQPTLDALWDMWQRLNTPTVIHTDTREARP